MLNKTTRRLLTIALAAGLAVTGFTACDAPEEADEPVAEEAPIEIEEEIEAPEAPPAQAEGQPIDQPPQGGMPGMDMNEPVEDDQVEKFAAVITALQELDENREDPRERMQAAETPQERQAIQQELMEEMQNAIEQAGLSFQDFMLLSQRLQQDENFRTRLGEHVDLDAILEGAEGGGGGHGHDHDHHGHSH